MNTDNKLTDNEFNSFLGITQFLKANNGDTTKRFDGYQVDEFLFKASDLLSGLDGLIGGRFKCDSGLLFLSEVFNKAIKSEPHMANKYFAAYSELMQMLVAVYNAESFIMEYSSIFENLANKAEHFDGAKY